MFGQQLHPGLRTLPIQKMCGDPAKFTTMNERPPLCSPHSVPSYGVLKGTWFWQERVIKMSTAVCAELLS